MLLRGARDIYIHKKSVNSTLKKTHIKMPKAFTQNLSLLFVKIFIVSIFFTVICGDDKLRIFYFNRSRKNVRGLLKFPSGLLDDGRRTLLARSR